MRQLVASLLVLAVQTAQPQQPAMPPMPAFDPQNAQRARMDDAQLAIETAADPDISPVPLAEDGSLRYGFILDRFLTARAAAAGALKRGKPLTAAELIGPNSPVRSNVFVVAYPLDCDGTRVLPKSISVVIERGNTPPANMVVGAPTFQPEQIAIQAGVPLVPEGSLGQSSGSVALAASAVTVTYDGPACPSSANRVVFRFKQTAGTATETVTPLLKLPAGAKTPWPAVVRLGGWIDTHGRVRVPRAFSGPDELRSAAEAAAAADVLRPSLKLNGVPVFQNAQVVLTFVGDGEPTAPVPVNPGPLLEPGLSLQVGGRIPVRGTFDWYGVSTANSQCPVSEDKTYGLMPDHPVKVGGGDRDGPARERAYMDVLRGGSGQATRYRRLGSNRAAGDDTILDIYELTFDGLPKPVRIYIDEYHWEEPKAPLGLVCVLPIPLTKDAGTTVVK